MRILERAPSGAVWSLLAVSPQTFHTTQELCDRMQKHVAGDGCVHGFCVDFENTRVHIRNAHELWIVAALTTAYNNSLTAQQLQYDADLYGRAYAPGAAPEDAAPAKPDASFSAALSKKIKQKSRRRAAEAPEAQVHTHAQTRDTQQREAAWDEELLGDRFIYDAAYEQNEDIVPWNVRETEERWGWYM